MADVSDLVNVLNTFVTKLQTIQIPAPDSSLPHPTTSTNTNDVLLSQSVRFEPFNDEIESFTTYRQRLENFFSIKQLTAESNEGEIARTKVLINCLGSKHYQLLCSLTAPELPSTKKYNELIKILEDHLCPKPNTLIEQHKFLSKFQSSSETIIQYITSLKQLTVTCNFNCPNTNCGKSISETLLRAQFIRGINDNSIREKLLQEKQLTFGKATEIALAMEASRAGNRIISNTNSAHVNRISRTENTEHSKQNRGNFRSHSRNRSKSRNKLDYNALGIGNVCIRCARDNHKVTECKIPKYKLKCNECKKTGHVDKVCIYTLTQKKKASKQIHNIDNGEEGDNSQFMVQQIHMGSEDRKFILPIQICSQTINFEVDSGSPVTIINKKEFDRLNIKDKLTPSKITFKTYTGEIFKPIGEATVKVVHKNRSTRLLLYVIDKPVANIMGRKWMEPLGLTIQQIKEIQEYDENYIKKYREEIHNSFADLFERKIGTIPNVRCSLRLQPDTKPTFLKARPVPYALVEQVNKELDTLESQGVITKTDQSEWGSPLVIVPKPNNEIRLCADYKLTVNPSLHEVRYRIPLIDDIFNQLKGGKYFCKLDIHKAFLHVQMDEDSSKIQAITTHRGVYKMNKLAFGVKVAPNEFQKIMDDVLRDIEGSAAYFDDVIITGKSIQECKERLYKCLHKLRSLNIHLNKEKCKFFEKEVQYLGHKICPEGLQKTPEKIEAIQKAPQPTTSDEVKSFLGLVMYYSKFIPHASTLTAPLRKLIQKNSTFHWSKECQEAFDEIKNEIISPRTLIPFDPKLPITLATDASPTGIAGVLSHIVNKEERPVAFISRALTQTEQHYSQLDREATAVYWSIQKLYNYLYGRKFTLICDNKPLVHIFSPQKKLPEMSASRLIRYASFLSAFDYTIQHRKSELNANADYLSRVPITKEEDVAVEDNETAFYTETINVIETNNLLHSDIVRETKEDPETKTLLKSLYGGGKRDPEYSIHKGIIMRGDRVFIPAKLRPKILQELHSTHIGIVRMKMLARRHVYWPKIDKDIELLAKSCPVCVQLQSNPPKVPTHVWDKPSKPWNRLHIDYAGPKDGYYYFVVMDAFSKWPEIFMSQKAPTSDSTINLLREVFSRYGLPCAIVSDNAAIFTSDRFTSFCKNYGIKQRLTAPNHPATNGQAERAVRILKEKLNSLKDSKYSTHEKLHEILFRWRATPTAEGFSPAQKFLGYNIKTPLDIIRPQEATSNHAEQPPPVRKQLSVGERVAARNYLGEKWKYGIVKEKLGKLHYTVKLDNGYTLKRHIDQLRTCTVPQKQLEIPKSVTFSNKPPIIHYFNPNVTTSQTNTCMENDQIEFENAPTPTSAGQDVKEDELPQPPATASIAAQTSSTSGNAPYIEIQSEPVVRRSTRLRTVPKWMKSYDVK